MAAKKTDKASSLVPVDITELGQGLKTAFTGIAMVFGSLGCIDAGAEVAAALSGVKMPKAADGGKTDGEVTDSADAPAAPATATAPATADAADTPATADEADAPDATDEAAEESTGESAEESTGESTEESAKDEIPPEEELPWDGTDTAPAQAPSKVTADDITKVIVAKIKQKRSNNAKIGALLKAYGVEKVSSLPAEKYEAFLTDISQL